MAITASDCPAWYSGCRWIGWTIRYPCTIRRPGRSIWTGCGTPSAHRLDHTIDCFGYRLVEPDGRRMLPDRLAAAGIAGPDVTRLRQEGSLVVDGRRVSLEEVSQPRRGQRFAFVMDTRL